MTISIEEQEYLIETPLLTLFEELLGDDNREIADVFHRRMVGVPPRDADEDEDVDVITKIAGELMMTAVLQARKHRIAADDAVPALLIAWVRAIAYLAGEDTSTRTATSMADAYVHDISTFPWGTHLADYEMIGLAKEAIKAGKLGKTLDEEDAEHVIGL